MEAANFGTVTIPVLRLYPPGYIGEEKVRGWMMRCCLLVSKGDELMLIN